MWRQGRGKAYSLGSGGGRDEEYRSGRSSSSVVTRVAPPSQRPSPKDRDSVGGSPKAVQEVYFKEVPVCIKQGDREDHVLSLCVKMTSLVQGPYQQNILNFQVTDEEDPLVLFLLDLAEEDFQHLKLEQRLKVDFKDFPMCMVELLENCIQSSSEDSGGLRYSAVLAVEGTNAAFRVIEMNNFKELEHIRLQLRAANDASLKQHLSERVVFFRSKLEQTSDRLETLDSSSSSRIRALEEELHLARTKLDNLTHEVERQQHETKMSHAAQVQEIRQNALEELNEVRERLERERRDMERQWTTQVDELKRQLETVSSNHNSLGYAKSDLESKLQDWRQKAERLEADNDELKRLLAQVRSENTELDRRNHEFDKMINQLRIQESALKQTISHHEALIEKTNELYSSSNESRSHLEETLNKLKEVVAHKDQKIVKSSNEIRKGNEIIQKLQAELKAARVALKAKKKMLERQETIVDEKERLCDSRARDLLTVREQMHMREAEIERLREKIQSLEKSLEKAEQQIQEDEKVISFMNNQITDSKLKTFDSGTSHSPSHASRLLYSGVGDSSRVTTLGYSNTGSSAAVTAALGTTSGRFVGGNLSGNSTLSTFHSSSSSGSSKKPQPILFKPTSTRTQTWQEDVERNQSPVQDTPAHLDSQFSPSDKSRLDYYAPLETSIGAEAKRRSLESSPRSPPIANGGSSYFSSGTVGYVPGKDSGGPRTVDSLAAEAQRQRQGSTWENSDSFPSKYVDQYRRNQSSFAAGTLTSTGEGGFSS